MARNIIMTLTIPEEKFFTDESFKDAILTSILYLTSIHVKELFQDSIDVMKEFINSGTKNLQEFRIETPYISIEIDEARH
jgi:hypothetical protein